MSSARISVWVLVFWAVMIFQVSVLPDTLVILSLGRIANAAVLSILFVCALGALAQKHSERVFLFYCFPVILVIIGFSVNILRSGRVEALSNLGLVLPWFAALCVPFIRGFASERYWTLYYRFMLVVSIIALVEYAAVFYGLLAPTYMVTRYGEFLKGIFTIFHGLDDDVVYNRMYGVFWEPGTYAMFLLPALAYALVHRRVLAAIVFLVCMVLTASLGGYIGLAILLLSFAYWVARNKGAKVSLAIAFGVLVLLAVAGGAASEFFTGMYANRSAGESAFVRESNVSLFFSHFVEILFQAPLGMDLNGETLTNLAGTGKLYIGSNFSIGTAMIVGGVTSLLGYAMFIFVNTLCWLRGSIRGGHTGAVACVYISFPALLAFVPQRTTVFESALYSFLFAAPLLTMLKSSPARGTLNPFTVTQ